MAIRHLTKVPLATGIIASAEAETSASGFDPTLAISRSLSVADYILRNCRRNEILSMGTLLQRWILEALGLGTLNHRFRVQGFKV